jgi:hypothetical protein
MHIVTDRLVLREFVIGDWPAVLAYQRDPCYLRFYPWINRKVMKLDLYCDDPSHAQKTQTYLNLLSCTLSGLWVGHLVLALLRIGESMDSGCWNLYVLVLCCYICPLLLQRAGSR